MERNFTESAWLPGLVKARPIIITLVLGIELALVSFTAATVSKRFFVIVVVIWYLAAAFFAVLRHAWRDPRLQARIQVLADLVFTSLVVYATGGIDTYFNFLYPLIILISAIMLPRYWAFLVTALSFIFFGAVVELSYFGLIPSFSLSRADPRALQATILINLLAYLAVAYLASKLALKLRRVNVELEAASGALQSLQRFHEHIIDSMSGGLVTTGLDGRVRLVNPAGARMLGYTQPEVIGMRLAPLFADELPQVGLARCEVRYKGHGSDEKVFGMSASALQTSDGGVQGQLYTFTDLTKIRRLEHELRMHDRMAAVGRLASGIAHEIRNPLAAIAGSAQMLGESSGLAEDERSLLDIVRRESERLNKIVTEFLAYSRDQECKFQLQDLTPLLEDTLRLLENRPECANGLVKIQRRFAAGPFLASLDGDRVKQVFWNICDNALRAMAQGGTLTVELQADAEVIDVSFADTGTGIDQQVMENIFEPFHSTFSQGSGLGLAIVYQIMRAHEGNVFVKSETGKGATFILRFTRPLKDHAVPAEARD